MSASAVAGRLTPTPRPVISAVFLTGATLTVLLPHDEIEQVLRSACRDLPAHLRLQLAPDAGVPAGLHPLLIDIWQLSDGRLELAGLTQHQWSELVYSSCGAAFGAALGALGGVPRGIAGSVRGGMDGVRRGMNALGRVGRTLSENSARALGNYVEVMFSIPLVRVSDESSSSASGPFSLSLGVYTDSKPACAIDQRFRYGLGKTLARIELEEGGTTGLARVVDTSGHEVLSASLHSCGHLERPPELLSPWLEAPLLGVHRASAEKPASLRYSGLRRHFGPTGVHALTGVIRLPRGPFGLPSGAWDIAPRSIGYDRVWSEITLPGGLS
jgi:hypothetical protein